METFIPDLNTNPAIALEEGVSADAKGDVVCAAGVSSVGVSSIALHKFVKE